MSPRAILLAVLLSAGGCDMAVDMANEASSRSVPADFDPALECPQAARSERARLRLAVVRQALRPEVRSHGPIVPADRDIAGVQRFVKKRKHEYWCHDRFRSLDIRRTGPLVPLASRFDRNGAGDSERVQATALGTHARVRVYYSPEVVDWLRNDRQGAIPDGAMIVKEMYPGTGPLQVRGRLVNPDGWAVMVRDASASHDGWLWYLYYPWLNKAYTASFEAAQYGMSFCLACHASAERESTFSALGNLQNRDVATFLELEGSSYAANALAPRRTGAHGGIVTDLGVSLERAAPRWWRNLKECFPAAMATQRRLFNCLMMNPLHEPRAAPGGEMLAYLASDGVLGRRIGAAAKLEPKRLPMDAMFDHVPSSPGEKNKEMWVTASNCSGCHGTADLLNGTMPEMSVPVHDHEFDRISFLGRQIPRPVVAGLSPYEEWSGSLMSVSARDPVFRAQLEWELARYPVRKADTEKLCFRCHAPMGYRSDESLPDKLQATYAEPHLHPAREAAFAALARDGVSCAVCHHISDVGLGEAKTFNARFETGKPDELYGPYGEADGLLTVPMQNALGITPAQGSHLGDSGLCGSCHMVETPVADASEPDRTAHEQTTYLEWRNSEFARKAAFQSCQDCHMTTVNPLSNPPGQPVKSQIANIEDSSFPFSPNRLSSAELDAEVREGYRRHTLTGINLFTMSLFQQFPRELGSNTFYPTRQMSQVVSPTALAMEEAFRLARDATADVEIVGSDVSSDRSSFTVRIANKAGHKFPTGVGFRRAFVEFKVTDQQNRVSWCSGCTNAAGVIIDGDGAPLAIEDPRNGEVEPHHGVIAREHQVQIFESRHRNAAGELTTSFLELDQEVKDTRLLPAGWDPDGYGEYHMNPVGKGVPPGASNVESVQYVVPRALLARASAVTATLYYQALPPYYLVDRFRPLTAKGAARARPEAQRLLNLVTRLDLEGHSSARHINDWKLAVAEHRLTGPVFGRSPPSGTATE